MMHYKFSLLFALAIFALASSHEDSSYDEASKEVAMLLQKGNDQSACADMAQSLADEVNSSVDEGNKAIASLDNGSSCPDEGQDLVTDAQSMKNKADKNASDAKAAASAAADKDVDFGTYTFSTLSEGVCGQFWKDEAYVTAKKDASAAVESSITADGAAQEAAGALDDAIKAAADAVKSCLCKARAAYDVMWASANENNKANNAAWNKANKMKCVLAGTAPEDCKFPACPKPTPSARPAVHVQCDKAPTNPSPRGERHCRCTNGVALQGQACFDKQDSMIGWTLADESNICASCIEGYYLPSGVGRGCHGI